MILSRRNDDSGMLNQSKMSMWNQTYIRISLTFTLLHSARYGSQMQQKYAIKWQRKKLKEIVKMTGVALTLNYVNEYMSSLSQQHHLAAKSTTHHRHHPHHHHHHIMPTPIPAPKIIKTKKKSTHLFVLNFIKMQRKIVKIKKRSSTVSVKFNVATCMLHLTCSVCVAALF